jgi:4-nitrophenyl phosphatase
MIKEFSPPIRALILDMDGVIWREDQPLGDLPVIFEQIRQRGYKVILATNNATLSISQYMDKLAGFGVTLKNWQIINSAQATAHYLKQKYPQGGPVFIVGENGLQEALTEAGFYQAGSEVLAVVTGLDRHISYDKLNRATKLIRSGAIFVGTNPDPTFPEKDGIAPGTGSILALLEAASEVKPIIIGKPAPEMYRVAMERMEVGVAETLVVGDRLKTDIAGAQELGCRTGLVLSGVTSEAESLEWTPSPDLIAKDLTELIKMI